MGIYRRSDPVEMTKDVEVVEWKVCYVLFALSFHPFCAHTYTPQTVSSLTDYPVYKCAPELRALIKPKSSEGEYEGWCWPGSSSWIDFFHPGSRDFWILLFKTETIDGQWSWTESTNNIVIWNDMNEVRSLQYWSIIYW
jgi:alpha 1,3-glucosidase